MVHGRLRRTQAPAPSPSSGRIATGVGEQGAHCQIPTEESRYMCVGIPALLQGTIKAKEERRGTPADGFAARQIW